jgi:basic membrane protein A
MPVRVARPVALAGAVLGVALLAAGCGSSKKAGSSTTTGTSSGSSTLVALVSDIGKFNDRSFNESQLEGLNRAKQELGVKTIPLQSNSVSDYVPNLTQGVRRKADLVVSAGFLLADATNTCLVGYLAAEMAKKQGGKQVIGAVGGLKIPPVDIWIAGYTYCAKLFNPKLTVLVDYSNDFVAADKCKTVAENMIAQGAQVLFQVAGGCGLGTLKAAAEHGIWGIGVDKDQYNDAQRVLTSGVKRVDQGVFAAVQQVEDGKFKGGSNLLFNLKNGGMSVGKINPAVPKALIDKMNELKQRIISGDVKVPTAVKSQ